MPIVRAQQPVGVSRRRSNYRRRGPAHANARALAVARGLGDVDLQFPEYDGSVPVDTGGGSSGSSGPSIGQQTFDLIKSIAPAGMMTLQEAIAKPGQVVKAPNYLITGANTNVASIPGFSTASNSTLLIGGLVLVGALLFMTTKKS